jgi:transposase-like protein
MEKIPNAVYTKELREEAVNLVKDSGLSLPEVGRRLSIPSSTIRYWVAKNKKGTLSEVGKQQKPRSEVEMELLRLKRELAEARIERDLLKKRELRTLQRSRSEVRDHKDNAAHIFYYPYVPFLQGLSKRLS